MWWFMADRVLSRARALWRKTRSGRSSWFHRSPFDIQHQSMSSTICDDWLGNVAPLQGCYECLDLSACLADFAIAMSLLLILLSLDFTTYISEKIMMAMWIVILWMEMIIDWGYIYIPTVSVLWVSPPRTPPSQNPVLPMELQDAIIRICDKSTLSSASLVCSTWLPLCRRRMTFAVKSCQHTAGLGRLLRNSRETISPNLRHLIISSECNPGDMPGLPQHRRLLRLLWLKHAPLRSVILDSDFMSINALSQYFPNITSLGYRFSQPSFGGGASDFRNLVEAVVPLFPQLRSLSFDNEWIVSRPYGREHEEISGGPLPITSVKIRSSFPSILPMLLLLERRCTNLVSFDCDIPHISFESDMPEEAATINNILKCNRQTLLHLTLPVHSGRCMSC